MALWLVFFILGLIVTGTGIWSIIHVHKEEKDKEVKRTGDKVTAIVVFVVGVVLLFLSGIKLALCGDQVTKMKLELESSIAQGAVTLEKADHIKQMAASN